MPLSNEGQHGRAIAAYAKAIAAIADANDSPFVDLSKVALSADQRKDDIHLNSAGYQALATAIQNALNLPDSGWATSENAQLLREIILRKNRWWFHRSRPANVAYVFGFRKREQGQNAVEIPKFDALIAAEEKSIASLRSLQPVALQERPPQLKSQYAKFTEQPTPEFTVGKDLEVTLWAENPQLNKPIQINFDPQGRLWVASSEAYPMIEVGQSPPDKILILEDTSGDGKADKSTVFAEGLLDSHRCGTGGRRLLCRTEYRPAVSERHRWRRQGRHQATGPERLRHRRHASQFTHAAVGTGRPAVHEPIGLHPHGR